MTGHICPRFLDNVHDSFSYFRIFQNSTDVGVTSINELDLDMVLGNFAFLVSAVHVFSKLK